MSRPITITLFGGLQVEVGERVITRFTTHKAASLLAFLAYHCRQPHPREVLIEMLWPDSALPAGRSSLSQALYSLRRQLEPPGVPAGSVLIGTYASVQLNPAVIRTDAAQFEKWLRSAAQATDDAERIRSLLEAVECYRGELLPGFYSDWVLTERNRLAALGFQALSRLVALLEAVQDFDRAFYYAHRAIGLDPLREEAHQQLMRLYARTGQTAAALYQYQELKRTLQEQLGSEPSEPLRQFACRLQEIPPAAEVPAGLLPSSCVLPNDSRDAPGTPSRPSLSSQREAGPASSLPLPWTRFFGRGQELARLEAMLLDPDIRLVTLTGPGGTGKTRLSLETVGRLPAPFCEAVWFVPLSDIRDARLIAGAVAEALYLPRSAQVESLEQVVEALRRQPSLLVLDNFEQLVETGTGIVQALLDRVPNMTCMVTSRQLLSLSGEREFALQPLPIPQALDSLEQLISNASVQLFVERAQAVRPDFQVTPQNAPAIAELCRRLEGIPLALELAAARAQVLTPGQILSQLARRFDFLVSRKRDVTERHLSLWKALEWSYRLLSPDVQRFFARLAVFRSGWTLEAAQEVCEEPLALEYLEHLRACSLVLAEEVHSDIRFRMLETLREFGWEQLSLEEQRNTQRRHAVYYLSLAATDDKPRATPEERGVYLDRLEIEIDNFRAALDWGVEHTEGAEIAGQLIWQLYDIWVVRIRPMEMVQWIERVVAQGDRVCAPERRAQLLRGAGSFAQARSHGEAIALLERSGEIFGEIGNAEAVWDCQYWIARAKGDVEGMGAALTHIESLRRERGETCPNPDEDPHLAMARGDFARLKDLAKQGIHIGRTQGDWKKVAVNLLLLGYAAHEMHDLPLARTCYEQARTSFHASGEKYNLAIAVALLGEVACTEGNYAESLELFRESLALKQETWDEWEVVLGLEDFAYLALAQGYMERAACLYGAAAQWNGGRWYRYPSKQQKHEKRVSAVHEALGEEAFTTAWKIGTKMSPEEAIAYALDTS